MEKEMTIVMGVIGADKERDGDHRERSYGC